jgi:hypothetical protein
MVDPITLSIVEMVGEPAAKRLKEWAKGSEANQLVKFLKPRFPNAYKLLTQPSVLVEIYVYAESGVFRKAEMVQALRAIADSTQQADDLAEAIRENQWRVMRDDRQAHQELRRLRTEIGGDISTGNSELLQGITEAIERLALRLPAARQLPAQSSPFVDRDEELADGQSKLATASMGHVATLVNCTGTAVPGSLCSRSSLPAASPTGSTAMSCMSTYAALTDGCSRQGMLRRGCSATSVSARTRSRRILSVVWLCGVRCVRQTRCWWCSITRSRTARCSG